MGTRTPGGGTAPHTPDSGGSPSRQHAGGGPGGRAHTVVEGQRTAQTRAVRGRAGGGTDDMGRRRDWAERHNDPMSPSRPPDAETMNGDPVYHGDGVTAVGYDAQTMNNFDHIGRIPGYHDVIVHGESDGFVYPGRIGPDGTRTSGEPIHPAQLADVIRSNPSYDGGPVRMVVCWSGTISPDAGAGVRPAAQEVADSLGVDVMAPTNTVGTDRHGGPGQQPQIQFPGVWQPFRPETNR
ncbi:hypothetical protein [Catenuloplanes japonicus]|uniref:hypothetical protein n=1 Tax=Catenuloplanes japonicus TaxID=33876 RepID=UPI00068FDBFD|nr:hypothetical protein [Catenuloplanes japonicus]